METNPLQHASAFAYEGVGCLLTGDAGSGKSRLLAEAIYHGATMIADDQVHLACEGDQLIATAVPHLKGVIELRGFGLIRIDHTLDSHPIHFTVRLDSAAHVRLPESCSQKYCGLKIPYLLLPPPPKLGIESLFLYMTAMREGRTLPPDWHPKG